MREKPPLERVITKYVNFLLAVKRNSGGTKYTLDSLIKINGINKTISKALFDLAIIDGNKKSWDWLSFEPDRKLSLTVLNYLLERSKKSRAITIPGMEETNAILKALAQQFSDYVVKREHSYKTHPIGLKLETLFSEQDTKQNLINKAAFAIATGVYTDFYDLSNDEHIRNANSRIVFAAKDLVNQLLK